MSARLDWPQAAVGPVARMRVLAAALPGAVVRERVMAAPFDAVWGVAGDLEHGVPRFEPAVGRARIVWRHGGRLTLRTVGPFGVVRFDVELGEGWCWMQEERRRYLVGMAAEPLPGDPRRTLFAHLEGVPGTLGRLVGPLVGVAVGHDLRGIERLALESLGGDVTGD